MKFCFIFRRADNISNTFRTRDGFKCINGSVMLSYKSLFQDVRGAVDHVHIKGDLKAMTVKNLAKYIKLDDRLPKVLHNIQKSGAKTFLLTNSEWWYTDKVMEFLLDFPDAPHAGKKKCAILSQLSNDVSMQASRGRHTLITHLLMPENPYFSMRAQC